MSSQYSCSLSKPDPPLQKNIYIYENGKSLVNCVYTLCPSTLYSVVQSCCSILSHDTHSLSNNSSLEDTKRELGHLFCYCRDYIIYFSGSVLALLGEYLKSGFDIQLITLRWDTACSSDPSLISRSGSGSRD